MSQSWRGGNLRMSSWQLPLLSLLCNQLSSCCV